MKQLKWTIIIFTFIFSSFLSAQTFNKIIVFGDSLSDSGNLYYDTHSKVPKSPPYFKGHFSNGEIWVEHLAQRYGLLPNDPDNYQGNDPSQDPDQYDAAAHADYRKYENFAVGGASAQFYFSAGGIPLSFEEQVKKSNESLGHDNRESDKKAKRQILYIVWFGSNDYIFDDDTSDKKINDTVGAIKDNIKLLIKDYNASMFLIANLPAIDKTPSSKLEGDKYVSTIKKQVRAHNQVLDNMIANLEKEYPKARFIKLDIFSKFNDILKNPNKYVLSNTVDVCYDGGYFFRQAIQNKNTIASSNDLKAFSKKEQRYFLKNHSISEAIRVSAIYDQLKTRGVDTNKTCPGYLFWDKLHPTALVHKELADFAYDTLTKANLYQG